MKKRGLSNLIATVLIVLLALAAVAIVWSFLRPPLERTGTSINLGTMCLESEAKPVSCVHDISDGITTVRVQHVKGQDVVDIIATVDYIGDYTNITRTGAVEVFATKNALVRSPSGTNATRAGAVPVVGDDKGNEDVCEESIQTIDCTNVA
jgi:hypothetical protein